MSAPFVNHRIADARALLSLARTQRRLSHEYAAWAREAEQSGKLEDHTRYHAEATRLWEAAKWHLQFARSRAYA